MNRSSITHDTSGRGRRGGRYLALGALLIPVAAIVAFAVIVAVAKPGIAASQTQFATLRMPFGGGSVEHVYALAGREQVVLPVTLQHGVVGPAAKVAGGEPVTVIATIKRPGWISWLTGSTEQVRLSLTTPRARLLTQYVTAHGSRSMQVSFDTPVARVGYGASRASFTTLPITAPTRTVEIPTGAIAGSVLVAAAARPWERASTEAVSWFPAGARSTAVATPAPGAQISAEQPITLTFQKPVRAALGGSLPAVTPAGSGSWETLTSHTIRFVPTGYGYGLGAQVSISLPSGVDLVGGTEVGSDPIVKWSVPAGSTTRLQQLLAGLGYLPVSFAAAGAPVADTIAAQQQAAQTAPQGSFSWRYPNTPGPLKALWQAGSYNELVTGAVMRFESDNDMATDGDAGPAVWKALIAAAIKHEGSSFGYTYVHVSETDPESEYTWHDGNVVEQGVVNTGGASSPTATGVFAVFEHLSVTTMSGTNPDGTTYKDPGIPWVSYFNGGDALHGFIRAAYGFPQSDGCVEMPYAEAGKVWPYTPVGTIVNVVS